MDWVHLLVGPQFHRIIIIIIIIIIITRTMFMVLSSWRSHCRFPRNGCVTRFTWWMQNSARWPPTFGPSQSAWTRDLPIGSYSIYLHHRHSLLLSLKADTHFTFPRRVEGWVDLMVSYTLRWLATFPPEGRERCSPVHNGLRLSVPVAVCLARHDARRINAEGDDDGKNHRYAENHIFR